MATSPKSSTTTGQITVMTPLGAATSSEAFTVLPSLAITISSPADGATLASNEVTVQGTLTGAATDVSVTVNGALAQRTGNQWQAEVPLSVGPNLGLWGRSCICCIGVYVS